MIDSINPTLSFDILEERKEYEKLFCACSFVNPDVTLEKCAWVEPCDFISIEYAEYWHRLKGHGDPMLAAQEAHLLIELTGYATQIPSSLFPEYYATEMKRLEYLWEASENIAQIALAISERDENIVKDKVAKLHAQAQSNRVHNVHLTSEVAEEFVKHINSQTPSLLTGLTDLDYILGGLFMGELTMMAGRPGIGKTSVVTAIAQNIATLNKNSKILFFSLEMDKIQLWARMACAKTSHSWQEIRSGRADPSAIKEVENASKQLELELEDRLIIEDSVWDIPTMISICASIRPSLVIIDHLSEIRWKDDNSDEVKWFGRATKILRTEIARRMHIPVILLHQLNRGVEGRENKRPQLSDLKWSGDLEAIADTVIMLYREDYYDDENPKKPQVVPMEMWIRKNRQGVMNSCAIVNFDTKTQRFSQARAPSYNTGGSPDRLPIVDNSPQMWYNLEHD